jgi:hypothetical protein
MSRMTSQEYKVTDAWESRYNANLDDALKEMFEQAQCIEQDFEHLLTETKDSMAVVDWHDLEKVCKAKAELQELVGCYKYTDYNDNKIEYDFTDKYNEYLLDAWGVTL